MKKTIFAFIAAIAVCSFACVSCTGTNENKSTSDTTMVDSLDSAAVDTVAVDSVAADSVA